MSDSFILKLNNKSIFSTNPTKLFYKVVVLKVSAKLTLK